MSGRRVALLLLDRDVVADWSATSMKEGWMFQMGRVEGWALSPQVRGPSDSPSSLTLAIPEDGKNEGHKEGTERKACLIHPPSRLQATV